MKCKLYPKYECPHKKWNPMTGFLGRLTPPPCESCAEKHIFKLTEQQKEKERSFNNL